MSTKVFDNHKFKNNIFSDGNDEDYDKNRDSAMHCDNAVLRKKSMRKGLCSRTSMEL